MARVLLGLFGLVGAGVLVRWVGPAQIGAALGSAGPWLPLAFAVEGSRVGVEAWTTRDLYARLGRRVPLRPVLRAQLCAYAVFVLTPAGRAAAELAKAGMLSGRAGKAPATAVAVVAQGAALVGTALVSWVCAAAAVSHPAGAALAAAVGVQSLGVVAMGAVILWAARRRVVGRAVSTMLSWAGMDPAQRTRFGPVIRRLPAIPVRAIAGFTSSRLLTVVLFFVLLRAVGVDAGVIAAFGAMGASLLGAAALDLVPADVGLTEAALALFREPIGATAAQAVAVGVLFHVVQIAWVAVSGLATMVWRPED